MTFISESTQPFHVIAKPAGSKCNLSCNYCFYIGTNTQKNSADFMSYKTLENFISQVLFSPPEQVSITWQGGEPTLLGIDFYKKAKNIAEKYSPFDKKIQWSIQTNGTLLDDEWCSFFRDNNYLVGISLDGPRECHNSYRKDSHGAGTFDSVFHAIETLKRHKVDFNVLCCVHDANQDKALEVYRFLRDSVGARYIQFIPIVERKTSDLNTNTVTSRSVQPAKWGKFLIDVFEEWVQNDVGKVFVLMFDWTLSSWLNLNNPACIFQQTCGNAVVLEKNGDIFSCDHFVKAENLIGNINSSSLTKIVLSDKQKAFGKQKSNLPKNCLNCKVRFACNGECPKNRFVTSPGEEAGLNFLCEGYKAFFEHVDKPMRMMAYLVRHGRYAEEIMSRLPKKKTA